jgi:hypothetical protein
MAGIHRFWSEQEETIMPVIPSIRIAIAAVTAPENSVDVIGGRIFSSAPY